jgi:hypothetical protein
MVKRLLLAVWLLVGTAAASAPQGSFHEDTVKQISVQTSCIMPKALRRGYVPVQITVKNLRPESVKIELELGNVNSWSDRSVTSGDFELAAGQSTTVDWLAYYMPSSHAYDRVSLRVNADSNYLTRHTVLQLDSSSAAKHMEPMLAISDDPGAFATVFNGASVFSGRQIRAEGCIATDLVRDWRAYTALRFVTIDLNSKTPEAAEMEAILDWTATGGVLVLYGTEETAQRFMAAHGDLLQPGKLISGGPTDLAPRKIYRHHFGRIVTNGSLDPADQKPLDLIPRTGWHLPASFKSVNEPPMGTFPNEVVRSDVQIPGLRTAPIAILIAVLVSFAMIVGPWQMKRQRRKQLSPFRFLLITPLIGFGFTVVILMASLLSQGVGVKEAVTSVTWLDQQTHKASTMAKRLTFSGSIFRNSLMYSSRAAAAPWPGDSKIQADLEYIINMNREGALEGHYLPVRMPTGQMVSSIAHSRGRVEIENENGVLYAINGLDVELQDFYYQDQANQWHQVSGGEDIGVNERVALTPTEAIPDFEYPLLPEITPLKKSDEEQDVHFGHMPFGRLHPRSYVARIPHSPFLEDGGVDRKVETQAHMLIGTLATEGNQ